MATVKQLKFAKLYVRGPFKGLWEAAAKAAGYKMIPSKSNPTLRELIGAEGGAVPTFFQPPSVPSPGSPKSTNKASKTGETQGDSSPSPLVLNKEDLVLPTPDDPEAKKKWTALAKKVMPIWQNIALGNVEANATQRQVLQNILDRGFGKAGQKQEEIVVDEEIRVVVLPALGAGAGLHICPRCNYEAPQS